MSYFEHRAYNANAKPEQVIQEAVEKLNAEKQRHEEAKIRIEQEHSEKMEELRLGRNNLLNHSGRQETSNDAMDKIRSQKLEVRSKRTAMTHGQLVEDPGSCLIIWNESHGEESKAGSLGKDFLNLGFEVRLRKNLSERETWYLLEKVAEAKYQDKKCFILTFITEGTSEYVKSADGKKIELNDIIKFFDPHNATGLRQTPKLIFFQCNGGSRGGKTWIPYNTPFNLSYADAFVLISTHSGFIAALKAHLQKGFVGEIQDVLSDITEELKGSTTGQGTTWSKSTLQRKLFFGQQKLAKVDHWRSRQNQFH